MVDSISDFSFVPSDPLTEKVGVVEVRSINPFPVIDDEGTVIGSAHVEGKLVLRVLIDKHHPSSFDLDIENGLAQLKLRAEIEDNEVSGTIHITGLGG